MNFYEHDMYPSVQKILRSRYPCYEKWEISRKNRRNGYEPDFEIERKIEKTIERIVVEVKSEPKITYNHISQLNKYARNLAGKNVKILKKIFVVPGGADTSIVSDDFDIIYMRKFTYK